MGFAATQPEQYLIDEYVNTRAVTPAQANALLRQEQIMAMQREYVNANEFAFNHLKEQLPLVVPQIVLACGQIMGDSSAEVVNKAAEHDYMSVIEQLVEPVDLGLLARGRRLHKWGARPPRVGPHSV